MIAGLALASVLLSAATRAPKVTVSFPSVPISEALETISKQSGLNLKASPSVKDDLLFVRVHDAVPSRLIAVIAKTLDAKWDRDGDAWVLHRDEKAERRRAVAVYEQEAATWRGSMNYLRKRLATEPATYDDDSARAQRRHSETEEQARKAAERNNDFARMFQFDHSTEETPAWRAGARLALLMDEATVLKMPYRAREVWAEQPTSVQSLFPNYAAQTLQTYRQELLAYNPQVSVSRVKLALTRWESGGQFSAKLVALGPDGSTVDQADLRLANDTDIISQPGGHSFVPPIPKPGEGPIILPELAIEQLAVLASGSVAPSEMMAKWRPVLCRPVDHEPLRLMMSAAFVAAAEAMDVNLVGTPDEQSFFKYWSNDTTGAAHDTPSQFFARQKADSAQEDDGWFIVRPSRPIYRLSRLLGQGILKDSVSQGGLSVDEAASWAGPDPYEYPFIDWLGDAVETLFPAQGRFSVLSTTGDEEGLRLWDALGEARIGLRRGQVLKISSLSPEAQRKVAELVYWTRNAFGDSDPTELFPNGIQEGLVSLSVEETPGLEAWASKSGEPVSPLMFDAQAFGQALASGSQRTHQTSETFQAMDRFRVGVFRTFTLHFTLMPGARPLTTDLSELMIPPDIGVLDRVPDALQAQIDAARRAELKKPPAKPTVDIPPPR
jgi:hypothetical protein